MQMVIDIPEETVNEIKDNAMFAGAIPSEILWDVTSAIVNGTPYETVTEFADRCKECGSRYGKLLKTEQFAEWVATEIFDDMWEYNKDAFAEIACRKLEKLGIVRAKGDEWELVEPQAESEE